MLRLHVDGVLNELLQNGGERGNHKRGADDRKPHEYGTGCVIELCKRTHHGHAHCIENTHRNRGKFNRPQRLH